MDEDSVAFDVLVRPPDTAAADEGDALAPRPAIADILRCQRWLAARGVAAHPTDFGLACQASPARFETLFGVKLVSDPLTGAWRWDRAPVPPPELAAVIDSVTLTEKPEFH